MIGEFISRIKFFLEAHPEKKSLLVTLLLLIALPVTILAALTVQNIRQRAAQSDVVRFTDANGIPLPQKVTDPNVYLYITLPSDWKTEESSSKNFLIEEAYAQPACRAETTTCGQPTYGNCTFRCSNERAFYDCVQTDNVNCRGTIGCPAQDSQCSQPPTPTTQVVVPTQPPLATCKTDCAACPTTTTCGVKTYDTCQDNLGQSGQGLCKNEATVFKCWASGNTACSSDSGSGIFNYSCSACPVAATATPTVPPQITLPPTAEPTLISPTQPISPSATPVPIVHILRSLTIENKDTDGSSGGHEPFSITSNFSESLNKPVYWKLNDLKPDQTEATRVVQVTLFDGTNYFPYVVTITLARQISPTPMVTPPPNAGTNEFLVDVFIHKSLNHLNSNNEISDWVRDAVNNYINSKFSEAGIKHRLKLNKIYTNHEGIENCPPNTQPYPSGYFSVCKPINKDNTIRVWLYHDFGAPQRGPSFAVPLAANVVMRGFNDVDTPKTKPKPYFSNMLMHEIGHVFTLPDYYFETVVSDSNLPNNKVIPMGIAPYIKDIMSFDGSFFSPTSAGFVNKVDSLPAEQDNRFGNWVFKYLPHGGITLRITDDSQVPISGVKVEVFQQEYVAGSVDAIVPDRVAFNVVTNENGEVNLGNHLKLFNLYLNGRAALLRITKDNQVRYMAITRSYLNYLYFQGQIDTATITKQFSSLVAYDPNRTTILSAQRPVLFGDGTAGPAPEISSEERKLLDEHLQQHLQEEQTSNNQQVTPPASQPSPGTSSLRGDINGDGKIDEEDLKILVGQFGKSGPNLSADLNRDGVVDIYDYNIVVENFGKKATP